MPNRYDLQDKRCLITGGSRGIGAAIADLLLASGARVIVWDAQPLPRADVNDQRFEAHRVDIVERAQIEAAMPTLDRLGGLDILVNNAGHLGTSQGFLEHPAQEWRQILAVNLVGTMQVTQAVLPHLLRAGGGRIVNLASLAGKEGLANLAAYSAASAGVIAFTKALGRELADRNIFVNCVAPGPIDTAMIRNLGDAAVARMIAESPMRRLGEAAEVAHLVAWLCSEASRFNTGAVFDISGGRARH